MAAFRIAEVFERPVAELCGDLELALRTQRGWRVQVVDRDRGWFELKRTRWLRADVSLRVTLLEAGDDRTKIVVEAHCHDVAERLASELTALIQDHS